MEKLMKKMKPKNDALVRNNLSNYEIQYLYSILDNAGGDFDTTIKAFKEKLDNISRDDRDNPISYIIRNHSSIGCVGGFYFNYYPVEESIEICDSYSGEYAKDNYYAISDIDEIVSQFDNDIMSEFFNNVRFCTLCGAPMDKGYTNESDYICSDTEFCIYMDNLYGPGLWRVATSEEVEKYESNYMYFEDGEWKPSDWYYTEWYDEYSSRE